MAFLRKLCAIPLLVACLALQANAAYAKEWQEEVVKAAAKDLKKEYVFKDIGAEIYAYLNDNITKYLAIDDPELLAQRLTEDPQAISNDKHLVFHFKHQSADQETNSFKPPPPDKAESRMLDDKVGYFKLTVLTPFPETEASIVEAMANIADSEAIIIDMRDSPGGHPRANMFLWSYFYGQPTHLMTMKRRGRKERKISSLSREEAPGPRFTEEPVYILINKQTFSAAEAFTFALQASGRALVVGQPSGGGGHFGRMIDLGHGISMFRPHGESLSPFTNSTWEATGIEPDIIVSDDDDSLAVALREALKQLNEAQELP